MADARHAQDLSTRTCAVRRAIVLDDDPAVLAILSEALLGAGLTVSAVASADAAFEAMGNLPAPSILVTDIDLGAGPDGLAVAECARARWPTMPIFIVSGGQADSITLEARFRARFFPKPVRMATLLAALTDAVFCPALPRGLCPPHQ